MNSTINVQQPLFSHASNRTRQALVSSHPFQQFILSPTSLSTSQGKYRKKLQMKSQRCRHITVFRCAQPLDCKATRKKLAVFVSGGGSNFKCIHEATLDGRINGDVVVLVTNKPGCGGAEYARHNDIPIIVFPAPKSSPQVLSPVELVATLRKLIPTALVQAYPRSVLNIHPSLLPAFGGKGYYGLNVHKAVIASGSRYSGPTVHFVDENYDIGRTLAQRVVRILADDTPEQLAARVLNEEHQVYVEAVAALCDDRILWRDDGVPLIQSTTDPDHYS